MKPSIEPLIRLARKPRPTVKVAGVVYTQTGTTWSNLFWDLRTLTLTTYRNDPINREVLVHEPTGRVYDRSTGQQLQPEG